MTRYFAVGAARNAVGVVLLAYLTNIGVSIGMALLSVVFFGFLIYLLQVRLSVGKVSTFKIAVMFMVIYFFNRVSLWILCENFGHPVYLSQIISLFFISGGSYLFLKRPLRVRNEAVS